MGYVVSQLYFNLKQNVLYHFNCSINYNFNSVVYTVDFCHFFSSNNGILIMLKLRQINGYNISNSYCKTTTVSEDW